jgi:hypothetical protein
MSYTDSLSFDEIMNLIREELEKYWNEDVLGDG